MEGHEVVGPRIVPGLAVGIISLGYLAKIVQDKLGIVGD